jgi:signal transduction histidine kinase
MAGPRSKRKPAFFWQALLIILPVAVLAVLGFFSLRQDRLLASYAAAERAQAVADELAPKLGAILLETNRPEPLKRPVFQTDAQGRLIFPPAHAALPVPHAFDLAELDSEQARLWLALRKAEVAGRPVGAAEEKPPTDTKAAAGEQAGPPNPTRVCRDFLNVNPPADFAAAAQYDLGLVLAETGHAQAAAEAFARVVQKYPDAAGESGLPLGPLAELKLLELNSQGAITNQPSPVLALETFCSNAVYHPSPLTSYLLDLAAAVPIPSAKADAAGWQRLWAEHEAARELFAAAFPAAAAVAMPLLSSAATPSVAARPAMFWFQSEGQNWLALRSGINSTGQWILRSESDLLSRMGPLVQDTRVIPEYFGLGLEVAGRRLNSYFLDSRLWHKVHYMSKGGGHDEREYSGGTATNRLASASQSADGTEALRVNVFLTSPATLFERESARSFWFGALISVAAAGALVGLSAAWRAFQRQLQLSELKSNFVSSVSHELRAPIASVRLLAESLERGKVPEQSRQQEYFRFIVQECRRLSSLIENVLDFSRIEQGRKEYEFEPTDLAGLTQQTVKLMETYAAERQVSLRLQNLQPATCNLQPSLDGKAIQQALVNLIDNALKHSPKGETVMVGLEVGDRCQGRNAETNATLDTRHSTLVNLWVEDHGPGIPASEHEKIFERFYRRGSELRRETQGVGIGLSIVKHIVEAHGGRVRVRSAVGEGSRFTIELPVTNSEDAKAGRGMEN